MKIMNINCVGLQSFFFVDHGGSDLISISENGLTDAGFCVRPPLRTRQKLISSRIQVNCDSTYQTCRVWEFFKYKGLTFAHFIYPNHIISSFC